MRTLTIGGLMAVLIAMLTISGSAGAAAGSCGDSWGSDGHSGPWYVASNQSLHGNTLVIGGANCHAATQWDVTYEVVKTASAGTFTPIMQVRRGNGPTRWSISTNPVGCNKGWLYYTQVYNGVSGNYIRKPNSGLVIC